MSRKHLILAAVIGALLIPSLPTFAKKKQEKTEWEFYGDPMYKGEVPGKVFTIKEKKKAWKKAGKPKFDYKANPQPYAVLGGNSILILYVDGERTNSFGPIKVKPGVHTVVATLAGHWVASKDCFELKLRCKAGREYIVKAHWEKKFFRKGSWGSYVIWRTFPHGYPDKRRAKKR